MKHLLSFFKTFLFFPALIIFLAMPVSAEKITPIKEVTFKAETLTIKHDSFGDLKFKKMILDNPPRLVYDLLNASIPKPYSFNIGANEFKAVKVSQFDKTTVRVVVEAASTTALEKTRVEGFSQSVVFKFSVPNVNILDVNLEDADLRIIADGSLVPRTIVLDSPDRLVLDLIGAHLKTNLQAKTLNHGGESIRIAQFDPSIVRIVFTGPKSTSREVRISDNEKQILVLGEASKDSSAKAGIKKITTIKLIKANSGESTYLLELDKKVDFKYLRLHDPERLVIDLIDTEFEESLGFNLQRETDLVRDLRFGLASVGRPITRMVFDLRGRNIVEDITPSLTGTGLYIKLTGSAEPGADAKFTTQLQDPSIPTAVANDLSKGHKVVIDAGHGGYDHGAIYGGHNEKDITLKIATKVEKLLKDAGVNAFMTRDDDRFVSLSERVDISNATKTDAFVSLHANALVSNPNMEGLQTYYYSNSGHNLAQFMHKALLDEVGMPDQRIRKANFWVCKYTNSPSVLLELGFMTNSKERDKLTQESYQNKIAKAVSEGLMNYFKEQ